MKNPTIETIHDVVCSWCPIGYAHLKQALGNKNMEVDIHFYPMSLTPIWGQKEKILMNILGVAANGIKLDEMLIAHNYWQ